MNTLRDLYIQKVTTKDSGYFRLEINKKIGNRHINLIRAKYKTLGEAKKDRDKWLKENAERYHLPNRSNLSKLPPHSRWHDTKDLRSNCGLKKAKLESTVIK